MYQFTTTNVINTQYVQDYDGNNLLDSNGATIAKYSGSATAFTVPKVLTFLKSNIVSVTKRPYTAGVKEILGITVPTTTSGKVYRLTVDLKLSQSTQSEYVNYSLDFKKPITVEILGTANTTTDAAAFVTQLNGLKNRFGHTYITASSSGADITLTAKEDTQRFNSVIIGEETANANSITQYDYPTVATGTVSTAGALGFGDTSWMLRTVSLPTAENVRYFGISKEERPIIGGNYTEYVIRYSLTKDGTDGIVSGGTSVTTHVFYVKSDLVTGFQAALVATGLAVNTIGTTVTVITVGTNLIDISNTVAAGATGVQLTYTSTTPASVTPAIFALTGTNTIAGSLDATKISLSNAGVFTMASGHGIAAGDTVGFSITIDGFTQTANLTFQA